jgi:hypothetical protein
MNEPPPHASQFNDHGFFPPFPVGDTIWIQKVEFLGTCDLNQGT